MLEPTMAFRAAEFNLNQQEVSLFCIIQPVASILGSYMI